MTGYAYGSAGSEAVCTTAVAVTPHASNPVGLDNASWLFIGVAGAVTMKLVGQAADSVVTLPAGAYRFAVTHVRATGTTATGIAVGA